jgi:hypothetical protein
MGLKFRLLRLKYYTIQKEEENIKLKMEIRMEIKVPLENLKAIAHNAWTHKEERMT